MAAGLSPPDNLNRKHKKCWEFEAEWIWIEDYFQQKIANFPFFNGFWYHLILDDIEKNAAAWSSFFIFPFHWRARLISGASLMQREYAEEREESGGWGWPEMMEIIC